MFTHLLATGSEYGLIFGLAGMAIGACFGLFGMYFHHRRRVMWHETARIALEKGQPIPTPSPDQSTWNPGGEPGAGAESTRAHQRRGHLLGGLLNVAIGIGLYIAFSHTSPQTAYFAAIPGCIGVAFLLLSAVEFLTAGKSGPGNDRRSGL